MGERFFFPTYWVPQRHLSLTHATEAGGKDPPVGHKDRPHWSEALMRLLLLLKLEQKSNISSKVWFFSDRTNLT